MFYVPVVYARYWLAKNDVEYVRIAQWETVQ